MALFENLFLALQSLKSNPLRSVLTLIGMAVGIGAVLYVVVLGELTQQKVNEKLEAMGTNVLLVRPGYARMHGVRTGENSVNLEWSDSNEIKESSNVLIKTVPTYSEQGVVEFLEKNWTTRLTGTTPEYQSVNNDHPIEGRFFNLDELEQRARVCVLGATVHEKLFGNAPCIGKSILIKSKRFNVIGLLGSKGESWFNPDDQIFMPLTTSQERLFGVDHLSSILAQMKSAEDYDEALFDIETILRRNHKLRPDQENDFRVRRQDFYLAALQGANKEIANFIIIIALVSLIVGGIGIANVMLVSVTERTHEIGIRRAIGAKKAHILCQFMVEAIILGVLGGFIGVTGGLIFNHFSVGTGFELPWRWAAYSFVICAGIGGVAGIYPAIRAANANVIDALRYE